MKPTLQRTDAKVPEKEASRLRETVSAFTLTEVLVAIAILVILSALLAPAARRALDKAQGARCVSNLRQCGALALTYSAESGGYFPAYPDVAPANWGRYLALRGYLGSVSYTSWSVPNQRSFTFCPSQPPARGDQETMLAASYGAALYTGSKPPPNNVQFIASSEGWCSYLRISSSERPSKSPLLFDSTRATSATGYLNQVHIASPLAGVWDRSGAASRHNGACNVLFMDGHVESLKSTADGLGKAGFQYAFDKDGNKISF